MAQPLRPLCPPLCQRPGPRRPPRPPLRILPGLPAPAMPRLLQVLRRDGYLVIPLVTLVALLAVGSSIIRAGFWSIVAAFLVSCVRPSERMNPRRLLEVLMRFTVKLDTTNVGESSHFLQDWLFRHIDEVDRPFGALLRSRGQH